MTPFTDVEEVVKASNDTTYGLAAGIWTCDVSKAHRAAAALKAGTVWINTYGYTDVRLPWGGSGDSGFGREHGDVAIENFTEPKAVSYAR